MLLAKNNKYTYTFCQQQKIELCVLHVQVNLRSYRSHLYILGSSLDAPSFVHCVLFSQEPLFTCDSALRFTNFAKYPPVPPSWVGGFMMLLLHVTSMRFSALHLHARHTVDQDSCPVYDTSGFKCHWYAA